VIRLVAAGCGRVFERFHLPALRSLSQWTLVGAAEPNPARRAWVAGVVPGLVTDVALEPLLSRLEPEAVLIASSPETHAALASVALQADAHVLIEKPMVLRVEDADRLVTLARQQSRHIRVGFNRRFRSAYGELRARLAKLAPENLRSIRFELRSDPVGWGSVAPHNVRGDRGEAVLADIASHQLDLVPWLLGRIPDRVRARYTERSDQQTGIEIELEFSGGLIATCRAAHAPGYAEWLEVESRDGSWVAGPGGLIRTGPFPRDLAHTWLEVRARMRAVACKLMGLPGETLETFRGQYLAWAGAFAGSPASSEEGVAADGTAGARCVALMEACRRSLGRDGTWIDVAPDPHQ
jgi:predicted dehydrogenase